MEHDGEAGKPLDALFQHIEAKRRRHKDSVRIPGALVSSEFISAVGSPDGNGQGVAAGP